MKEDRIVERLASFTPWQYITESRFNGRTSMNPDMKLAAATLYEQICRFRSQEVFISHEVDALLEMAERLFFSDWFLYNEPQPRYPAYTNVKMLNWVLGTHQRKSLTEIWEQCWSVINLLAQDLTSFEICSLAGIEKWQQNNYGIDICRERIQALQELKAFFPQQHTYPVSYVASANIPSDWWEYLSENRKALALIQLTAFPQTTEHDEFLFLRTIHISESCFWGILTSVIAAMESIKAKNFGKAARCLEEAARFAEVLVPLFQAFKTMPPDNFTEFRDATGNASAIQSRTYQLVQIFTQGFDERKAESLLKNPEVADLLHYRHSNFRSLRNLLQGIAQNSNEDIELIFKWAEDLDKALYAWRCLHLGIARAYLPPQIEGTGGTHGAPYLATHFRRRVFPVDQVQDSDLVIEAEIKVSKARPVLSSMN